MSNKTIQNQFALSFFLETIKFLPEILGYDGNLAFIGTVTNSLPSRYFSHFGSPMLRGREKQHTGFFPKEISEPLPDPLEDLVRRPMILPLASTCRFPARFLLGTGLLLSFSEGQRIVMPKVALPLANLAIWDILIGRTPAT